MRTILVAGMMLAASAAGAQDFGVNFRTVKDRIVSFQPPVQFESCDDEICSFRNNREDIDLLIGVGKGAAVERFSVIAGRETWALAAEYLMSLQRDLHVPGDQMVDVRRLAERAASGNGDISFSKFVLCKSDVGKVGDVVFTITCSRAR